MEQSSGRRFLFALLTGVALLAVTTPASTLREGARLAGIYDSILDARFDQADQALSKACPPAPAEACRALGAVAIWWQILLDPESHALDERLQQAANASVAASEAWTRREPKSAEAWFYLAGSYAPLAQWQALRGQRFGAARNGLRIKSALERAVALDPELRDAYFGIGMYHYWADVAPAAAKLLRLLLLLPGGDREKGLQEMLQARAQGVLLSGEADFQLHWLYLWFEKQPARALDLVRSLDARYPSNPIFLQRIAEIEHEYQHDHRASAAAWEQLIVRAARAPKNIRQIAEMRARLGLAGELLELSQPLRAIDTLNVVVATQPTTPFGAPAIAQWHLGVAYDQLGERELAVAAYNAAIALAPKSDPERIRARAREALRKKPRM